MSGNIMSEGLHPTLNTKSLFSPITGAFLSDESAISAADFELVRHFCDKSEKNIF